MDKNIAAILKQDSFTVVVQFDENGKEYVYICDIAGVTVGDYLVVPAMSDLKIVTVKAVHDDLQIEPNSNIKYKWVIGKVDMAGYMEKMAKIQMIEQTISTSYQANMRRSFAETVMAGLDEQTRLKLQNVMS